jgi:hypothetical protein
MGTKVFRKNNCKSLFFTPTPIMFYLYILKSKKDSEMYIGSTNDLKKRLLGHNSGKFILRGQESHLT